MDGQAQLYDLGYQAYTGPREGRSRARRAVFENGVRTLLGIGRGGRAKILPALLFLAAIAPALVFIVILAVAPVGEALPGAADYYGVVGIVLVIFGAIMAPELLISDRRSNVLQLYLVRPLTSTDYVVARFLAFFAVVLALVYSGQVILQVGLILTAEEPLEYLRNNWLDVPRFLAAGVVVALFITAIPLAVATVVSRRAYVAAFVIAAFLVSSFVTDGLVANEICEPVQATEGTVSFSAVEEATDGRTVTTVTFDEGLVCEPVSGRAAPYIALFNLFQIPQSLSNMIFDQENAAPAGMAVEELNGLFPIGMYLAFTLLPCAFLWQRYRRLAL